jgi:hypothetical protein
MVTSMPTTSRLMQQMARMRLGWVCFLPASTAVAASLPVSDVVGALLFGKGLKSLDAGPAKRILSIPLAGYGLLSASTNYPKQHYGSGRIRGSLSTSPVLSDFGR